MSDRKSTMLRSGITKICRAVILADDSALWKVAGLRQLERLALAVTELGVLRGEEVELCVLWSPDFPQSQRFLPRHPRLSLLEFPTAPLASVDLLLSTRVFLHRISDSIRLKAESKKYEHLPQNFAQLLTEVRAAWKTTCPAQGWDYLEIPPKSPLAKSGFCAAAESRKMVWFLVSLIARSLSD